MRKIMYEIAKADFLERVRRFSFIVMIALTLISVFFVVPNPDAVVSSITINPAEFAQSSDVSWVLFATSVCAGLFFPIIGVAYIKNAIDTDRTYGMIDLIQTSSTQRTAYLFGKLVSNCFLLLILWIVLILGALIMSVIKFPNNTISVKMLVIVFLGMLPNILFCAAIAVIWEIIPVFRNKSGKIMGTVFFFFLMIMSMTVSMIVSLFRMETCLGYCFDVTNLLWNIQNVENIVFPISGNHANVTILSGGDANLNDSHLPALLLDNLRFSKEFLIGKTIMLFLCITATAISSFWVFQEQSGLRIFPLEKGIAFRKKKIKIKSPVIRELGMRCRNVSYLWSVVLLLLWGTLFILKTETAYSVIYPLLCIASLPIFSDIGCREYQCGMEQILSVSGIPFVKQLVFEWISALFLSIIMILPLLLRFFIDRKPQGMMYLIFALFFPSLSAALGEYTKGSRVFELFFIILCYILLNISELIIVRPFMDGCILIFISGFLILAACLKRMYKIIR